MTQRACFFIQQFRWPPLLSYNQFHSTMKTPFFRSHKWPDPAVLFLVFAVLIGAVLCVLIPYGAGFDEEQHLFRIFEISGLELRPNHSAPDGRAIIPSEFLTLSYQRRHLETPASILFNPDYFTTKINPDRMLPVPTRSVYPPVIFFPQALVARIGWRILNLPVLPVVIACRLAGLLLYLLGCFLAIRILPRGKWVMLVLALSPMALFQASTLNADGYTNAVSFLFIAAVLNLYFSEKPIGPLTTWGMVFITLLLGLAKPGSIILLPLLLILPVRKFQSKKLAILVGIALLLAVVLTFSWSLVSVNKMLADGGSNRTLGHQAKVMLANPLQFISIYFKSIFSSLDRYYYDWVGVYGYWIGTVPGAVYWLYPLALLAAVLAEPFRRPPEWKLRAFLAALFVFCTAGISFIFYYKDYVPGDASILSGQGRYFIALAPLLFIALASCLPLKETLLRFTRPAALLLLLGSLAFYGLGLNATYYTYCGASLYTGKACSLPVYKNFDKASLPEVKLNPGVTLQQTFTDYCGKIQSVTVLVNSLPVQPAGSLTILLLDEQGAMLAQAEILISNLEVGKYFSMNLNNPAGKLQSVYTIQVDGRNIPQGSAPGLAINTNDYLKEGSFTISGKSQDTDLIFHYTCPNPYMQTP